MLKHKVAVITGGSRGIGKAIARKFATSGADIAIIYSSSRDMAENLCHELSSTGIKARCYCCNVSDFHASENTIRKIAEDFGTIDILVNNAGITRDSLIFSMTEENWDCVIDTNLKGTFNMTKHCSPYFLKKHSGKIINISSVAGLSGNQGQTNYSASKAGMIGLTKTIARELASKGICCNAIAPGIINTDMSAEIRNRDELISSVPMRRIGTPEDIAETALFLAGNGSDYITGEVIRVDGGLAM
ncbi:MAG: 3-oxoacyl-[acyl-carrier-protein] reductase [Spirochaetia bacterium]|nr:3-oxoacyl-[acyl-carrier-protein] reductase [Spirochaetia bacterium]